MNGTLTLVVCSSCFAKKQSMNAEVVAGFDQNGNVYVKRYHNGMTKITGDSFQVHCGACDKTLIFKERRQDEILHQWFTWLYRQSSGTAFETIGSYSDTNSQSVLGTN